MTELSGIIGQQPVGSVGRSQTRTVAQVMVARINDVYSRAQAARDGIYFWPEPLPTPQADVPDPLTLFETPTSAQKTSFQSDQLSVLPCTLHDIQALRDKANALHMVLSKGREQKADGMMRIPLGLVDVPEEQRRDTFFVDLHGAAGALSGGPLVIAGAQNSGKATALQTMLLWLLARHTPRQLRLAIIDPNQDLDIFQDIPFILQTETGPLFTDGSNDDLLNGFVERFTSFLTQRRERYPQQRWNDASVMQLRTSGEEIPQLVLILHHYHSFDERFKAKEAVKKLFLMAAEARMLGVYVVVTSSEVSTKYLPIDVMAKVGTRIGLFLSETQRYDFLGRVPFSTDPIPGRGLVLTRDRNLYQVQLALPVAGENESTRFERLKQEIQRLCS